MRTIKVMLKKLVNKRDDNQVWHKNNHDRANS